MADSSLDLLALNREILLNPKAPGTTELVALLELEVWAGVSVSNGKSD